MKEIEEMDPVKYIHSYMIEVFEIVKEWFAHVLAMLNELHSMLEKLEINSSLNNYIATSFIAKKHINTAIEIFKNMVRDAARFIKK